MAENSLMGQVLRDRKLVEGLSKKEQANLGHEVRWSVTIAPGYRFDKKRND